MLFIPYSMLMMRSDMHRVVQANATTMIYYFTAIVLYLGPTQVSMFLTFDIRAFAVEPPGATGWLIRYAVMGG
ncbi:hypothetical protein DFH08DRAFT_1071765 [Mycena albidolilacea]|uniref:Uncharacterized protein n=1 Tax=Mycena albidolilacea TaxID=1033008 RepID=A0AAD7AQM0_9AGAR|nr:hypothetical protein DFH08DRAFT_1071765 [Mycena albidolilacea]